MDVTIGLILYKNIDKLERLFRTVIRPTVSCYKSWNFEIIVVDNSPKAHDVKATYLWNGGKNLKYAGAMNQIVSLCQTPYLVYLCTNHGRMTDPSWIEDILGHFDDEKVLAEGHGRNAMAGHLHLQGLWGSFIQGGVWAAQTDIMKANPYSMEYPHQYSDCWISRKLLEQGYGLVHVPTIRSLWHEKFVDDGYSYKYIHDESCGGDNSHATIAEGSENTY